MAYYFVSTCLDGPHAHAPARKCTSIQARRIEHRHLHERGKKQEAKDRARVQRKRTSRSLQYCTPRTQVPKHPAYAIETDELCMLTTAVYKALPFP